MAFGEILAWEKIIRVVFHGKVCTGKTDTAGIDAN
jgi:hypothetical protein